MALSALMKGHSATTILMVDSVKLGPPHATDGIDIGTPFEAVSELLSKYSDKGGRVVICGPCMIHNGMAAEQMDPRFEILNAPDVIALLMQSTGSLQVTWCPTPRLSEGCRDALLAANHHRFFKARSWGKG